MTPDAVTVRWTPAGRAAAAHRDSYITLGAFLATFSDGAPAAWSQPWVAHEIADRKTLETLLVPSNQGEYLSEIEDTAIREALIEELLTGDVLPVLHAGPAGTALGYNVHWTFGDFRRCDR